MSPKLPILKPKELVKILKKHGFIFLRQDGSHAVYIHPDRKGKIVVVPMHNKDLRKGTLKGILNQAGIDLKTD